MLKCISKKEITVSFTVDAALRPILRTCLNAAAILLQKRQILDYIAVAIEQRERVCILSATSVKERKGREILKQKKV